MTTIVVAPDKAETCLMDDNVTFVGTFRIPDHDAWLPAIARMSDFVASNVPRVRAFHAYANAEGTEGTVVYVHPDADSLDQHLATAAQLIEEGTAMVRGELDRAARQAARRDSRAPSNIWSAGHREADGRRIPA